MTSDFFAYLALSLLCALINIAPAVSHLIQGHSGPASFGIWVVILNLLGFINGILWMNDAHDKAPIFCDVSAKLTMVGPLGLLIANCCIIRYLARIVTPNALEDKSTARARIWTDYVLSFGIPAFIAILSVVFQVARYEVESLVGCSNVSVLSWPTIFIFIIWSPIMCGIACGYSLYVLYWLIRQHNELSHLIARSRTPLNKSRFMRMCALAATYLCISAPYTVAGTVTILNDIGPFVPWKSWGYIHDFDNKFSDVRNNAAYQLNVRDWLSVTAGLTVFFFFSFANESIAIYAKLAHTLRLAQLRASPSHWLHRRSQPSRSLARAKDVPKHSLECVNPRALKIAPKTTSAFCKLSGGQRTTLVEDSSSLNSIVICVVEHTAPDLFQV